jgi:hypothetical protein
MRGQRRDASVRPRDRGDGAAGDEGDELRSVAQVFVDNGWPTEVDGDALTAEYSAPSAGPPPWYVYRVEPSTLFALGTSEPYGATKFDVT